MPVSFQTLSSNCSNQSLLVTLNFISPISLNDFADWLLQMSDLLALKQPFIAIYHSQPNLVLPSDYRNHEARWYKANKADFFKYCQALVRIANDEVEQQKLDTPAMHKAWQVPYAVVMNEEQAFDWLRSKGLALND